MNKSLTILILALIMPISLSAGNIKPTKVSTLKVWLEQNLTYPSSAIENKEEGIVYVSFTVTEDGRSENVKIEQGISPALDNEAVKAVINMPLIDLYNAEQPNKTFVLPVKFTLD